MQVVATDRPAEVNRRVEREELQKWAVTLLRSTSLAFDAVVDDQGEPDLDLDAVHEQAPLVQFYEDAFEWEHMSYLLYPYFWGRRAAWAFRRAVRHPDQRHEAFLRAGSAKVLVPVTPGFERRVLHFLDTTGSPEAERIGPAPDSPRPDSDQLPLWLELFLAEQADAAMGSGRLRVTPGSDTVTLVGSSWRLDAQRDVGRELFVEGLEYEVTEVFAPDRAKVAPPFGGAAGGAAREMQYAIGSVAFGSPWLVTLPTTLLVLGDQLASLPAPG